MKKVFFICALLLICGFAPHAMAASSSTVATTTPPQTTEAAVREYFADIPVMIEIARCESKFRQFTDSGNVLRGGVGQQMVGVFQFFDRYHENPADELGFDIKTLEGNLAYARHMYVQESTAPWDAARDCWDIQTVTAAGETAESDAVLREKIALLQQVIELLQTLLAIKQSQSIAQL